MKVYAKRFLAMILSFALVFAIPFAFTQEASAAAKKKTDSKKTTVHLVTNESLSTSYPAGVKYVSVTKYSYNKKGFRTKYVSSNNRGNKETFKMKYNSKGYMTSCKVYDKNNKQIRLIKVKMKKGRPSVSKEYKISGNKKNKTLIYKQNFVYKGKKLVKIKWTNLITNTKGTETVTSSGSSQNGSANAKYDRYKNLIEDTRTTTQTVSGVTITNTYKITHQYEYDLVGNILEDTCVETTITDRSDTGKKEYVTTTVKKYRYKKAKVFKKYLEQIRNGSNITLH